MDLNWTPEELSFIAEQETTIKITPNFNLDKMDFISGSFGSFRAGHQIKVPLWLGLHLNKKDACTLHPPSWLTISILKQLIAREKENKEALGKVPSHYIEVAFAFFNSERSNIVEPDLVRSLIEDLWTLRIEKIRSIFTKKAENLTELYFTCENITKMEVHMFREPISAIISILASLYDKATENQENTQE
ncbi:Partner of SLD five, PSF2 family protein [Trichomonas vaginalis G3]|uniref:Partner of SLD five, PSF2 family protein n=1 Tax=Trichomonas vaginalis (strain ATCC PRA-98 / G3) TaxID=412133 RepID=A2EK10_TRIV3|nr:double-strand break repair via break-induced replication [Trichomonas vaginalis G3]EAY06994.1 Partner of SLD five, PSF2 family protein [Trichomonas vaginalis G3]KAI5488826.1 double-strand break repair via break-induced replication [Trichomonas vaginalis G3]|eukprot:XP_001319217.1 Partner of SLD five, PSF2 family protein [Trichomonas vaginalis G3]